MLAALTSTAPMALTKGVPSAPLVGHHLLVGFCLTLHTHSNMHTASSSLPWPPVRAAWVFLLHPAFLQEKICPFPGILARMLNPDSREIAFESMTPALLSPTL